MTFEEFERLRRVFRGDTSSPANPLAGVSAGGSVSSATPLGPAIPMAPALVASEHATPGQTLVQTPNFVVPPPTPLPLRTRLVGPIPGGQGPPLNEMARANLAFAAQQMYERNVRAAQERQPGSLIAPQTPPQLPLGRTDLLNAAEAIANPRTDIGQLPGTALIDLAKLVPWGHPGPLQINTGDPNADPESPQAALTTWSILPQAAGHALGYLPPDITGPVKQGLGWAGEQSGRPQGWNVLHLGGDIHAIANDETGASYNPTWYAEHFSDQYFGLLDELNASRHGNEFTATTITEYARDPKNLDEINRAFTQGYTVTDADGNTIAHFEPGGRAVWEQFAAHQGGFQRAASSQVTDPLNYPEIVAGGGGVLTDIGEQLALRGGRAWRTAGDIAKGVGTIAQAPEAIQNAPFKLPGMGFDYYRARQAERAYEEARAAGRPFVAPGKGLLEGTPAGVREEQVNALLEARAEQQYGLRHGGANALPPVPPPTPGGGPTTPTVPTKPAAPQAGAVVNGQFVPFGPAPAGAATTATQAAPAAAAAQTAAPSTTAEVIRQSQDQIARARVLTRQPGDAFGLYQTPDDRWHVVYDDGSATGYQGTRAQMESELNDVLAGRSQPSFRPGQFPQDQLDASFPESIPFQAPGEPPTPSPIGPLPEEPPAAPTGMQSVDEARAEYDAAPWGGTGETQDEFIARRSGTEPLPPGGALATPSAPVRRLSWERDATGTWVPYAGAEEPTLRPGETAARLPDGTWEITGEAPETILGRIYASPDWAASSSDRTRLYDTQYLRKFPPAADLEDRINNAALKTNRQYPDGQFTLVDLRTGDTRKYTNATLKALSPQDRATVARLAVMQQQAQFERWTRMVLDADGRGLNVASDARGAEDLARAQRAGAQIQGQVPAAAGAAAAPARPPSPGLHLAITSAQLPPAGVTFMNPDTGQAITQTNRDLLTMTDEERRALADEVVRQQEAAYTQATGQAPPPQQRARQVQPPGAAQEPVPTPAVAPPEAAPAEAATPPVAPPVEPAPAPVAPPARRPGGFAPGTRFYQHPDVKSGPGMIRAYEPNPDGTFTLHTLVPGSRGGGQWEEVKTVESVSQDVKRTSSKERAKPITELGAGTPEKGQPGAITPPGRTGVWETAAPPSEVAAPPPEPAPAPPVAAAPPAEVAPPPTAPTTPGVAPELHIAQQQYAEESDRLQELIRLHPNDQAAIARQRQRVLEANDTLRQIKDRLGVPEAYQDAPVPANLSPELRAYGEELRTNRATAHESYSEALADHTQATTDLNHLPSTASTNEKKAARQAVKDAQDRTDYWAQEVVTADAEQGDFADAIARGETAEYEAEGRQILAEQAPTPAVAEAAPPAAAAASTVRTEPGFVPDFGGPRAPEAAATPEPGAPFVPSEEYLRTLRNQSFAGEVRGAAPQGERPIFGVTPAPTEEGKTARRAELRGRAEAYRGRLTPDEQAELSRLNAEARLNPAQRSRLADLRRREERLVARGAAGDQLELDAIRRDIDYLLTPPDERLKRPRPRARERQRGLFGTEPTAAEAAPPEAPVPGADSPSRQPVTGMTIPNREMARVEMERLGQELDAMEQADVGGLGPMNEARAAHRELVAAVRSPGPLTAIRDVIQRVRDHITRMWDEAGRVGFLQPDVRRFMEQTGALRPELSPEVAPKAGGDLLDQLYDNGALSERHHDLLSAHVEHEGQSKRIADVFDEIEDFVLQGHPGLAPDELEDEVVRRFLGFYYDKLGPKGATQTRLGQIWDAVNEYNRAAIMYNPVTGVRGIIGDALGDTYVSALAHGIGAPGPMNNPRVLMALRAGERSGDTAALENLSLVQSLHDLGIDLPRELTNVRNRADVAATGDLPLVRGLKKIPGVEGGVAKAAELGAGVVQSKLIRTWRGLLDQTRRVGLFEHTVGTEFPRAANRFQRRLAEEAPRLGLNPDELWAEIQSVARTRVEAQGRKFTRRFTPEDVRVALNNTGVTDPSLARSWRAEVRQMDLTGRAAVNKTLFSYRQTKLDYQLGRFVMFNYWQSRALYLHGRMVVEHPALLSFYTKTYKGMANRAEKEGYPPSVRGYLAFMGDQGGAWSFLDPVGMLTPFNVFREAGGSKDARGWEKLLRTFHVFLNPQLQGAANILGYGTSAVDPTSTYSVRNMAKAVINYDRNGPNILNLGPGVTDQDFVDRVTNGVFQTANNLARKAGLPLQEDLPERNPQATPIAQINNVILTEQEKKYGPLADWDKYDVVDPTTQMTRNPVKDEALEAETAVRLDQSEGNALATTALGQWSRRGLLQTAAKDIIPGGTRDIYNPTEQRRDLRNQFFTIMDQGGTPSAAMQAATTQEDIATAGSAEVAAALSQQGQYETLGTDEQQFLKDRWNAIANARLNPGETILVTGPIGPEVYSNDRLARMTEGERRQLADIWVDRYGGVEATTDLQNLRTQQDVFRTGNPQIDAYKTWQSNAFDWADSHGGVAAFRKEMSRISPGYKQYINGLKSSLTSAELDTKSVSLDAYEASRGERLTLTGPKGGTPTDISQVDPSTFLFGGTGTAAGGGTDDLSYFYDQLATYQEQKALWDQAVAHYTGGQTVNSPFAKSALAARLAPAGIFEPSVPGILADYQQWATARQAADKTLDVSPEAFIAWRQQFRAGVQSGYGGALPGTLPASSQPTAIEPAFPSYQPNYPYQYWQDPQYSQR